MLLKIRIHYMTVAQIFSPNYSLEELTLVAKSQSLSAGFKENHAGYDGHRL